jgi:D-arabinose 1-dehydrogenase-like Zn-dependent alcohol dehydrogenase
MKALRLVKCEKMDLVETPIPEVGAGEVLLQVTHCALCRTDAKMWSQGHRDLSLPRILGHEVTGYIDDPCVRYTVWPGRSCGSCAQCSNGKENLCTHMKIIGFHKDGGLSEQVGVRTENLMRVPDDLEPALACMAEPMACALNAVEQTGVCPGEKVLIIGSGTLGLMLAMWCHHVGAAPVIVEKLSGKRAKANRILRALGLRIVQSTNETDYNVAINAAPGTDALTRAIDSLRPEGRLGFFSGITGDDGLSPASLNPFHYRQLHLVGAYGCTRMQVQKSLDLLLDYHKVMPAFIEKQIRLEEVPEWLPSLLTGQHFKFLVRMR